MSIARCSRLASSFLLLLVAVVPIAAGCGGGDQPAACAPGACAGAAAGGGGAGGSSPLGTTLPPGLGDAGAPAAADAPVGPPSSSSPPDASSAGGCGGKDQACCAATTCSAGLTCTEGRCSCGIAGSACCGGTTCAENLQCTKGAPRCTCVRSCAGRFTVRNDGAIIWDGNNVLKAADGQRFVAAGAPDIAAGRNANSPPTACVVKPDGTVWCWGSNDFGALGAGIPDDASAHPRQVIAGGGAPLTGATRVATNETGRIFCAIADGAMGKVWCWGSGTYGLLGTGTTGNTGVAGPVLTFGGGEQLAGAVAVSVGEDHACVVKADGTTWCWGGYSSDRFIARELPLSETASDVVCAHNICCAIGTTQGNVWCWGPFAAKKLAFKGGAEVTGMVALKPGPGEQMYGLKNDLSLLSWNYYTDPVPVLHQKAAITAPHHVGQGCLITNQGEHLSPTSNWVPFCE